MSKTVRAITIGFYGGSLRKEGDIFDIADNAKIGKWMELISDNPGVAAPAPINKPLFDKKGKKTPGVKLYETPPAIKPHIPETVNEVVDTVLDNGDGQLDAI